jgi:hypothetical protein
LNMDHDKNRGFPPHSQEEQSAKVLTSMFEAEFALFEMQKESGSAHSAEPSQTSFSKPPESLNSVDIRGSFCKLIRSVTHPVMFLIPEIHKHLVVLPAVRVDNTLFIDFPLDNGPEVD